jgi:hypothetical protein
MQYEPIVGVPKHLFDMQKDANFPFSHLDPSFLKSSLIQRLKFDYSEPLIMPFNNLSPLAKLNGFKQICLVSLRPMHEGYILDSCSDQIASSASAVDGAEAPLLTDSFFQDLALSYKALFDGLHKYCLTKMQPARAMIPVSAKTQKPWSTALLSYLRDPERIPDVIYHDPHVVVFKDKYQKVYYE